VRALSTQQQKVFAADARANHLRISVKDSGGTFRDLSTYPGLNMVVGAQWSVTLDQLMWTLSAQVSREVGGSLSLAPDMQGSALNRAFNPASAYAELLAGGREIKVEVTFLPADIAASSSDWINVFHGYIDTVDAGGDPITITARDLGAKLQDRQIEVERVYGFTGAGAGCRVFAPSTAYALNEYVIPTTGQISTHFYKVTTAGTSGATEPTWNTGGASTTTSGTVTFTEQGATTPAGQTAEAVIQAILDDNLGAGVVTLNVPVSPAFQILPYLQSRSSVLEAVQAVAEQRGWDIRYRWDSTSSTWKLTLSAPNRGATVPDQTFSAAQYVALPRVERDIRDVRNAITVIYSDPADLDTGKVPKRKSVTVLADGSGGTSNSIGKYGRRYMEVAEEGTSHIDTSAEATNFANAMLFDLMEPLMGLDADLPLYPFAELGDLFRFSANGIHFDNDQDLAVVSISHSMDSEGKARTKLTCSGKPAVGRDRWHDYEAATDTQPPHSQALFNATAPTLSSAQVVGGTRLTIDAIRDKHTKWEGVEIHVSDTSPFTPTASTLKAKGLHQEAVIPDLIPGQTYYARVVPYGYNDKRIVRGQPTPEAAFVAGFAKPLHMDPDSAMVPQPPNGDFGGRMLDIATQPPDRWTAETGVWRSGGADVYENTDDHPRSGKRSITFGTALTALSLLGDWTPCFPDQVYAAAMWAKASNVAQTPKLEVLWYDYTRTLISTSTLSRTPAGTAYYLTPFNVTSPSTARWYRIRIGKTSASANTVEVDDVHLLPVGDKWHLVGGSGEPAFLGTAPNDWQNFGSPHDSTSFMRDVLGRVTVRLAVKTSGGGAGNPPIGANIFTLPVGYRPGAKKSFACIAGGNVLGRLNIDSAGNVSMEPGMGNSTGIVAEVSFMADL
jgi:hypothetical protein